MQFQLKALLFLVFCASWTCSGAQNAYVNLKDRIINNARLIDQGPELNCTSCCISGYTDTQCFSPSEVSEYRFADGRKYVSREIKLFGSGKKVFLEVIEEGVVSLLGYELSGQTFFFLEKEGQLSPLPESRNFKSYKEYRQQLIGISSDKARSQKMAKYTGMKRTDLSSFIGKYNEDNYKPIINTKFGISAGFASNQTVFYDVNNNRESTTATSFISTFSLDVPILRSIITYHPDLVYTYTTGHEYYNRLWSLNASLLKFRLNYRLGPAVPFLQSGMGFGYMKCVSGINNYNVSGMIPIINGEANIGAGITFETGPYSVSIIYISYIQLLEVEFLHIASYTNSLSLSLNF